MAGETDLVRQLRKLAAPQTTLLLQDKVRPSLLFDPKEASILDRDTVFAYGCNGLNKLMLINAKFAEFESSLFSQSIVTFERSVQTQIANKNLDDWVHEFLTMLSPYFLLRSAHEALEWVIYRFRIHMFNIDSLIACVLPHYHTRIFVRVLQLIDLNDESFRWHWLQSTKKSGKPLELSILLKQFNSDRAFRKFVCDLTTEITKVYSSEADICRSVISFSTVTIYYALKLNNKVTDSLVTLLFPFIVAGLKSQIPSYCAGVYAIISILVAKLKFTNDLLEELLIKICNNFESSLLKEGFELIAAIFEHQDIKKIPKNLFNALVNEENSLVMLKHLSDNYSCDKFVMSLIKKSIVTALKGALSKPENKSKNLNFALQLFHNVRLEGIAIEKCFSILFKEYVKLYESHRRDSNVVSLQHAGKLLLKCFENCWPTTFDKAIESFFQGNPIKQYKCALDLINISVNDPRHQVLSTHGVTLFLGLNHANALVREHAIKSLINKILDVNLIDRQYVVDSLRERICDDNPNVALAVLNEKEVLLTLIPKDTLFGTLKTTLKMRGKSSRGRNIQLAALKLLCCQHDSVKDDIQFQLETFEVILPFLFPVVLEDMDNFLCIIYSTLVTTNPFLNCLEKTITKEWTCNKSEDLLSLNKNVLKILLTSLPNMAEELVNLLFCHFFKNSDVRGTESMVCIFTIFLSMQMAIDSDEGNCELLIDISSFLQAVTCSKKICIDVFDTALTEDAVLEKCMRSLQRNQIPLSVICFGFRNVLKRLQFSSSANEWWPRMGTNQPSGQRFQLLLDLFIFFVTETNSTVEKHSNKKSYCFKILLACLIKEVLMDVDHIIWFLSFIWSGHPSVKSNKSLQVSALQIAVVFSEKLLEEDNLFDFFFVNTSKLFPTLLVALQSGIEEVRSTALKFLSCCIVHSQDQLLPFKILSKEICNSAEEIRSDHDCLVNICDTWLLPAYKLLRDSEKKPAKLPANALAPSEVYNCLMSLVFAKNTPCHIRKVLLLVLQKADVRTVMNEFLTLLDFYLQKYAISHEDDVQHVLQLLIKKYNVDSTVALTAESGFLKSYLNLFKAVIQTDSTPNTTVLEMALKTLSKEFFFTIPSPIVQQKLIDVLVDLYLLLGATQIHSRVGKMLKKFCASAYLLLKDLPDERKNEKNVSLRQAKRSRLQNEDSPTAVVLMSGAWKKITVVLEIVQNKKNLHDKELLIPELFRLLNCTLDWKNQPTAEYLRQLILSSIFNCCKEMEPGTLDEHKFQIELVIQCIRTSDNPKTHHQALLLLNLAATLFPDHVLRNVMSIFTFMGKNLIRQDDSYSFQIISQTIETIVPALLQASKQQQEMQESIADNEEHISEKPRTVQVIATIIRKFVDSLPDIPRHRQLPLFMKLISTLESSDYLWVPIAQICERYAYPSKFCYVYSKYRMYKGEKDLDPTLEFVVNFHQQFSLCVQLDTCLHLINHLAELPLTIEKENSPKKIVLGQDEFQEQMEPLNLANCSDEKLQDYRHNLLCYLNLWLSSQNFVNLVDELDTSALHSLEVQYKALHESTLRYMHNINDVRPKNPNLQNILKLLQNLLNNINSHLPCRLFIDVITSLLKCSMSTVQQNALKILSTKLEHNPKFFAHEDNHKYLLKLLKKLINIVKKSLDVQEENALMENASLSQTETALTSIYLICKLIGSQYQIKFYKVLDIVSLVFSEGKKRPSLLVSAFQCFSELCSCLNALMLPRLNSFMPKLIDMMEDNILMKSNDNVVLGLVKVMHGLVKNLGSFLSSYMDAIVTNICILSARYKRNSKGDLQEVLSEIRVLISNEITPRVLIASIHRSYKDIVEKNIEALGPLVSILAKKISECNHVQLEDFSIQLQSFYVEILALRSNFSEKSSAYIDSIEKEIIDSLIVFVLKLSEPRFAMFFNQIFTWAAPSNLEENTQSSERSLTFYRLTCEFSKTLKNLFVVFAKKFSRHAASVMNAVNSSKTDITYFDSEENSVCLLNYIIDTFSYCFKFNETQLGEKEFFDVLMLPLVDQLENELGGEQAYQDRIENRLSGCIAHFMMLFSDSALWKSLNYQVLLKTRHSSAKVRFATLQVIREIVKRMNNNYLVLLPESIPFLAEIMEDESFEVEQECQDVIADMEKILGEPIKTYF